jgi:hypothetical protein
MSMTGEEKLQAVIDVIKKAHEELIRGDTVEISSGELERTGMPLNEQSLALDVLANEYKCIEYTTSRVFGSEDDLSPYDLRDIAEISQMNGLSEKHIKQQFLELMTYEIKVLENFDSILTSLARGDKFVVVADKSVAQITLNRASKTARLTYQGISCDLKTFKSVKNINYIFLKNLLDSPDEALDRNFLGVSKYRTRVKDLPKTAGFTGELIPIFFDVDTKNQKLTLHPKKSLTPEERETINFFVKKK